MKDSDAYSFVDKMLGTAYIITLNFRSKESKEKIINIFFCALCLVDDIN